MGTHSKRGFEGLPDRQKQSQVYYEGIARGPFRQAAIAGAAFTALADVECSSVCFTNTTGKTVGIRRGAAGVVIQLPNNSGKVFDVVDNAQELQVNNQEDADAINLTYECGGEHLAP